MKLYRWIALSLIGVFLVVGPWSCSTPPKGPDDEQVRKRAKEGMQDLRLEEERQEQ